MFFSSPKFGELPLASGPTARMDGLCAGLPGEPKGWELSGG